MSAWSGKWVWIIGKGYLGTELAGVCRAAGAQVLTIDESIACCAQLCADAADISTYARAQELCGCRPDYIFCCLATRGGSVDDYRRVYLGSAGALVAAGLASRVIYCTSSSLYGERTGRSEVLAAAEDILLAAGACVVRPAALYGPGRCELLRRHLAGEPCLPGEPERVLNYVHVSDAAAALFLLAERGGQGVYALCGESFTRAAAYDMLERVTGVPRAAAVASPGKRQASRLALSSERLTALGWKPSVRMAEFVVRTLRDER